MRNLRTDERGVTPAVSKTLAIGIALLYIGGMTTLLFGSVVPGYQSAAGDELAERTLATAAGEIEQSVPEADGTVEQTQTIELPDRIDDERFTLELSGRQLVLEHPDREIGGETRLSLPENTFVKDSSWRSGDDLEISVTGPVENRTLQIEQ